MTRKEQIELAKEWEALGKRMRILKDELEPLGLRRAEIEDVFDSDIEGTTLYQVLDDEDDVDDVDDKDDEDDVDNVGDKDNPA